VCGLPHLDYCWDVWDKIGTTLSDRLHAEITKYRAAIAIVGRKNEHGQSELALDVIKLEASERTQNPVCGKSYV
jgi:hypothetical protein